MNVRLDRNGRLPNFVPSLGRVSSGDEGLAEMILRVRPGEFIQRAILERPVRETLIILFILYTLVARPHQASMEL